MARVRFTPHLKRFFDLPDACEVEGDTVAEVLRGLDARWPGLAFYVADERGALRLHVGVWVDGAQVVDRARLTDAVRPDSEVHILQALTGG